MREAAQAAWPIDRQATWVARKVNRERVVLLGWSTAILMQFAHPKIAAAIADHSTAFAGTLQWFRRYRSTLGSMLDLTFGDDEAADRTIATINAIHRRVRGTVQDPATGLPPGTPYSAEDPVLLRWVHVTLEYAMARTYELLVGPLTREEKDRGCAESVATMLRLGIPEPMLPISIGGVYRCLDEMLASGDLAVGEQARRLARQLLYPPLPAIVQPLLAPARLVAIGLLPPWVRTAYGFRWDARREFALRLFGWIVRCLLPLMPAALRFWPAARRHRYCEMNGGIGCPLRVEMQTWRPFASCTVNGTPAST